MKVKCSLKVGNKRIKMTILEIDDQELAGKNEEGRIDVINRHFHRWLWNTIDADWEAEDS